MSELRRRFLEVNGEHQMTPMDDAYVRMNYRAPTDAEVTSMLAGALPLPSYLLSDGSPMVPQDHSELLDWQGDGLEAWFKAHWPDDPDVAESEWRDYLAGRHVVLRQVTPRNLRRKAWAVETITNALPVVDHDVVARGAIGEAVEALEQLLLPLCPYDRLRFEDPLPLQAWADTVRRDHLAPPAPALPLHTSRLVLRAFTADDGPAMWEYNGDAERQRFVPMGPFNQAESADRARIRAAWTAPATDGSPLMLAMEFEGRVIGDLMLLLHGPALATGELGWMIHPDFEGRGFVTEGAREMLRQAFDDWHLHRVWADLDARNDASARVCERLGMRRELDARANYWMKGEWTPSYRYALLAAEWSARRQRG